MHGRIPVHKELLAEFGVSDNELKEIDSRYRVLEHVWHFNNKLVALFLRKVAESKPKPTDFQGLMYLVAQTELEDAKNRLKTDLPPEHT
jgi:hypothetical protein